MPVPFTSVPFQDLTTYTQTEDFDTVLRGAWSSLTNPEVKFFTDDTGQDWSTVNVPLLGWAGNSDKAYPMRYWGRPYLLRAQSVIQANFRNSAAGEPEGVVDFIAEISGGDLIYQVDYAQEYRLRADLSNTSLESTTGQINYDVLIYGAMTNVPVTVLATVTDNRNGWPWSKKPIPVRAMAGVAAEVNPIMIYHKPYLLRANARLQVSYSAATSGGFIEFVGQRIAEGREVMSNVPSEG